MSNLVFIPQVIRRVDSNIQVVVSSSWARRDANSWWRRIMKTRPSTTKKELIVWLLETARISEGGDGKFAYDDMVGMHHEIENESFGVALTLSADDIEDALGSPVSGNALDFARNWAKHIGSSGAYWPQQQAAILLKHGKKLRCYDGGVFFGEHPVSPGSSTTFINLFTGYPFSPENLAKISAYIKNIKGPDGAPRHLVPRIVAAGTELEVDINTALGAEWFISKEALIEGSATKVVAGSNMVKTTYNYEPPIIAPELDEPGVWYLFCELVEDEELAGLIFQQRKAFMLSSYAPVSDADLGRMDSFEWHFKGRNAASYGHPFLVFRVESNGDPNLPVPAEVNTDDTDGHDDGDEGNVQ